MNGRKRAEFLARACGSDAAFREEVESLLANEVEAASFLQTPALGEAFAVGRPESLARNTETSKPPSSAINLDLRESNLPTHPERIGEYRILGVLGQGGMGVVYQAEQESPRRTVALKVIRPGIESHEVLKRFAHEAEVLGWFQHPGIAQIYEAGTADAGLGRSPFFAMELVRGQPLTVYAHRHRLDIRARLELLARVCDAVHHAHQKGVIHRDLKPGNLLVDETGQPKILDFGVARATDASVHPMTLLCMSNLAGVYRNLGRLDKAEDRHRRALAARREVRGAEHPDTLLSMYNLGLVLQSQERFSEAESLFREALAASREVLGGDHLNTLATMQALGEVLVSLEKFAEA